MDELRFVRRDDLSLIVSNDTGDEFRLVVDDAVLSELRHLSRRDRDSESPVKPREIQALIRAGKTRAEVASATGLEEADVERYEEPVLAERRYILERAHAVPVRTGEALDDEDQQFGEVIAERLIGLGSEASEWDSWKDPETGWHVSLDFIAHDVSHRAIWSFEHRKGTLAPVNADAANLSKHGEVGDRLIPKLRAVENGDGRFDSDAFDAETQAIEPEAVPETSADAGTEPSAVDVEAEYERRREIDHRAVKTEESSPADFTQTADLLDALRRRRSQRERGEAPENEGGPASGHPAGGRSSAPQSVSEPSVQPAPEPGRDRSSAPRSIWSAAGVSGGASEAGSDRSRSDGREPVKFPVESVDAPLPDASEDSGDDEKRDSGRNSGKGEERGRKGRASIPSWDDILFGTRSDEDPA